MVSRPRLLLVPSLFFVHHVDVELESFSVFAVFGLLKDLFDRLKVCVLLVFACALIVTSWWIFEEVNLVDFFC